MGYYKGHINRLKKFLRGKRIILVGNSSDLIKYEHGEFIDSHDVVIRMGAGTPEATDTNPQGLEKALGKRTDIWAFGIMRARLWEYFKDAKHFLFIFGKSGSSPKNKRRIPAEEFGKVSFVNTPADYIKYKEKSGLSRPSTGNILINYLVNDIKSYKELSLIGFDFFSCERNELKSRSFHKRGKKYEVHKGLKEKKFTRRLEREGKLKILDFTKDL